MKASYDNEKETQEVLLTSNRPKPHIEPFWDITS